MERLESRALFSAAPVITTQPISNIFVMQGNSATLTAAASGDPTPTVQWEVSIDGITAFAPIANNSSANTDTLILPDVQLTDETNQYEAVFANSAGSAATNVSTLYVEPPTAGAPVITTQPANQTLAAAGDTATFTAAATGTPTPTVQWYVEPEGTSTFTPITGNASATTTALTLPDTSASANGNQYEAVFSNSSGNITSSPATLTVPQPSSTPESDLSASLTATPQRQAEKFYSFTVTYNATTAIDTSTFDIHNIFATGPDNYEQEATFMKFSSANGGKTVSVTYRLKNSGSQWNAGSNGTYHVYVRSNQVKDANGVSMPGGILGPFKVLIA